MCRRSLAILLAGCLLVGCQSPDEQSTHDRTIIALGTLIHVEIYDAREDRAEQALDALEAHFQTVQREWYAFGDGELGRANEALSRGETVALSPKLASLTRRSLRLRALSDGLFDPTIGMLVELWGFGDTNNNRESPPDDAAILQWRREVDTGPRLTLEDRTLSVGRPIKLTFGGIAKGTALTEAATMLTRMGINNAVIDAGGDLTVLGKRGDRLWRIGIRDPHSPGVLATLDIAPGEAIVTSGNYERYFNYQGTRYHHLLDPRTALPVTHTAGVTVIDGDAELADAAATALMVAGAQRFHEIAARMGIEFALLVGANGDIIMTPALTRRIREPEQILDPLAGIMAGDGDQALSP